MNGPKNTNELTQKSPKLKILLNFTIKFKDFPTNSKHFFSKLKDFEKTQAKNSISGISENGQCSESGQKKAALVVY